MSIAVSVLTTSRVDRNSNGVARQENRPQSATVYRYSSVLFTKKTLFIPHPHIKLNPFNPC